MKRKHNRSRSGTARDPEAIARRKLYSSQRWRNARARYIKANPLCVICGAKANTVDHAIGHGPRWRQTFWNEATWQSMCASCHSTKSGHESNSKRKARRSGLGLVGDSQHMDGGYAEDMTTGRRTARGSMKKFRGGQSERPDIRIAERLLNRRNNPGLNGGDHD